MNPIIFLWVDPRSISTAIERGDFASYLEHHLRFYHKLRKHSLTSLAHGQ
jgi:hypothetical protein